MKNILTAVTFKFIIFSAIGQGAVGIGTTNPNIIASLDLGSSGKPLILPRLTTPEMNAVNANALGLVVYNTTEHQLYAYMRYRTSFQIGTSNNRWQPISTGPQMIAWGVVDSFANIKSGSGNFTMDWNASSRHYELTVISHPYVLDSMILMITPMGGGSWDQIPSTWFIGTGTNRKALIKFTDATRITGGSFGLDGSRRPSWFQFVLYNLRQDPYNILNP